MISNLKKKIPRPLKRYVKYGLFLGARSVLWIKRKSKKTSRYFSPATPANTYSFAILCIKKTVYADFVIDNVNSLHYVNPSHTIIVYCDATRFDYLEKNKNKFDYTDKVFLKNTFGEAAKPWQYYKIDTLIEASKQNQILTDADGFWHDDPIVDQEKITLLVVVNKLSDNPLELKLAQTITEGKNLTDFKHYVSGFVSIPSKYMDQQLERQLRDLNDKIYTHSFDFISDQAETNSLRRLSEELSVSLSLQLQYGIDDITTLKKEDGPGSKQSLESFYYGCLNQVIE